MVKFCESLTQACNIYSFSWSSEYFFINLCKMFQLMLVPSALHQGCHAVDELWSTILIN
jgi:hypothetical protein